MSLLGPLAAVFGLAALLPLLVRWLDRDAGYLGAAVLVGAGAWLSAPIRTVLDGQAVSEAIVWLPAVDVELALRLDTLGLLFAWIVLGIGACVLAYSARYFPAQSAKTSRYLSLLTFFAASMLGLVLADDVIWLFVFWEFTSVSSFFLIGGLGEGKAGATRAFIVTAVGGLALLAGLLLLGVAAGTTSLQAMLASGEAILDSPLMPTAIVLLLLGAFTKSAQFPFHFWLPGAMVAPTPVSTYLHAATMVKAGIYLLFRFTPLFGGEPLWLYPLVLIGLLTAVFAAVVAIKADDLKSLLAYSTVSQLGLLTALIGIGTPLALATAGLHTLAHALFKATLFMTVGIIDHETGTRDLRELGGLRRQLPATALAGGLAAASMAGLPPLVGFVSKEEAFAAFAGAGGPAWLAPTATTLAVLASIGTVTYSARYYLRTFEGRVTSPAHRPPLSFDAPPLVTAVLGLLLGAVVPVLDEVVNTVSRDTTGVRYDLHLALWHGLTLPLALSVVVVGTGALLVWRAREVERFQRRVPGPSGDGVYDRIYAATLALGEVIGRPAASHRIGVHVAPVLAGALAVGAVVTPAVLPATLGASYSPGFGDWLTVALIAGAVLGVTTARTRLGAVATLGLTGFLIALWFAQLGAPDLALTQLLVETLTVALVVVVFRRLPHAFAQGGRPRQLGAAVIAVGVGSATAVLTYLLTGRRGRPDVAETLLERGPSLTGGDNVVNTILVDFRALDTLGEITVLAVAAAAIVGLVRFSADRPVPEPDEVEVDPDEHVRRWGGAGMIDSSVLRTGNLVLAPLMVLASLWLLLRGHNVVGGGFIGGLTAGAAVVLLYFSRGHERIWQSRLLRTLPLAGAGVVVASGYGLAGIAVAGSYLAGGKLPLPLVGEVAASLVFDVGVYLIVIGMIVAILRHLGQGLPEEPEVPRGAPPEADPDPDQAEPSEHEVPVAADATEVRR
ncbi:MAG: hydrogen gas-evolving membrane-bound hydrogenase subunit E [Nitriliruptoraceae bacterium]